MLCAACLTENDESNETCRNCHRPLKLGPGSVVADRYELDARLGEGGMGMVYKAYDRVLDETVALKILRPSFARTAEADKRFRSEIKLARKVSHRNVCRIHEYGEDGALRYLSMEFVDGVNLKQAVRGKGGLPIEEARELTIQIAKGLQAIHDVGIIHRDLKTANIMRDSHGVVRLMDFGIAKKWQEDVGEGVTGVGDIIGTPEYMSPEQSRGQKIDFRSDIYALGIVTFELLTGQLPFRGETPLDTLLKHVQEAPPLDGRVPPTMVPILGKALAKDPRERYASARGLIADLRAAARGAVPAPLPAITAGIYAANLDEVTPITGATVSPFAPPDEDSDVLPASPPSADVLADIGEPADERMLARVRELAVQLADADVKSRWRAAVALWQIGPTAREALPSLRVAIDDDATSVSDAAAEAYKRISGQPAPPRKPKAPEPPPPPRTPPAVQRLIGGLHSSDSLARWRAVLALGALGPAAASATPALVEALDDPDDNVRWSAATALGNIGAEARDAVPGLAAALSDRGDPVIHRHAAAALAKLGPAAKDAVPGLIGALRDPDSTVREEVIDALIAIGPGAVPALIEALQDEDAAVRFEAANTLTKISAGLQAARPQA
jgi:HEAT repeat protein/predicted Ser/Thr protein kinase